MFQTRFPRDGVREEVSRKRQRRRRRLGPRRRSTPTPMTVQSSSAMKMDRPLSNSDHLLMIDHVALAQILSFAFIHVRIVFWVLVRPAETRGGARISSARRTPMSSSTVVIYYNILLLHLLQKKCSAPR